MSRRCLVELTIEDVHHIYHGNEDKVTQTVSQSTLTTSAVMVCSAKHGGDTS